MAAVMATSSSLPILIVMLIPFGSTKLGVEVSGWYVPALVIIWSIPRSLQTLLKLNYLNGIQNPYLPHASLNEEP